jgi:nucleotide-binding universal stress UspA family protein
MFNSILISTDGSKPSEHAAKIGIKLARLCRAKVLALYVADTSKFIAAAGPTFPYPDVSPMTVNETYTSLRDFLMIEGDAATRLIEEMANDSGIPFSKTVVEGYPASAILEFAEKSGSDLIVIGSIGRTGFGDALLGGVAGKVIHASKIPIFVVPWEGTS